MTILSISKDSKSISAAANLLENSRITILLDTNVVIVYQSYQRN